MKRILFLAAIIVTLVLSVGCSDETTPSRITDGALSPSESVENLTMSFDTGDIGLYKSCISEDFTFYFNPDDVGTTIDGGYVIPESWTYPEDIASTESIFTDAYSISFDLPSSQIGSPVPEATDYIEEDVPIAFLVMLSATDGLIADGLIGIEFRKIPDAGERAWKITAIRDHTVVKKSIKSASLGKIKAIFHSPPTK